MKIIKLQTGSVVLTDDLGNYLVRFDPDAYIESVYSTSINIYSAGKIKPIEVSEIIATKVEPEAEVPFIGKVNDLVQLLSEQFFTGQSFSAISDFDMIAGNTVLVAYYASTAPGTDPANPSGSDQNVRTLSYLTSGSLVVTKTFEYNSSDNVTKITVS